MDRELSKGSIRIIEVAHRQNQYICRNCCGVEDVAMPNRDALWKHLDDFHEWQSRKQKDLLSIQET
jgi:hypothetical protein